jgi:hypothetical protein
MEPHRLARLVESNSVERQVWLLEPPDGLISLTILWFNKAAEFSLKKVWPTAKEGEQGLVGGAIFDQRSGERGSLRLDSSQARMRMAPGKVGAGTGRLGQSRGRSRATRGGGNSHWAFSRWRGTLPKTFVGLPYIGRTCQNMGDHPIFFDRESFLGKLLEQHFCTILHKNGVCCPLTHI